MPLLTLADYRTLTGVDPTDDRKDAQVTALLPIVGDVISNYVDRKFVEAGGAPQDREFTLGEEGFVDIDDCTSITKVSTNAGYPGGDWYDLDAVDWTAEPGDDYPTYYYLRVHGGPFRGYSPEMGFKRNLDKIPLKQVPATTVRVTATWGWPAIPDDIKLAAAWFIQDIIDKPRGDNLSAEAIQGYSRAWAGSFSSMALPSRSRDLIARYQRAY